MATIVGEVGTGKSASGRTRGDVKGDRARESNAGRSTVSGTDPELCLGAARVRHPDRSIPHDAAAVYGDLAAFANGGGSLGTTDYTF